jgi:hypothetical protein
MNTLNYPKNELTFKLIDSNELIMGKGIRRV